MNGKTNHLAQHCFSALHFYCFKTFSSAKTTLGIRKRMFGLVKAVGSFYVQAQKSK